MAKRNPIIFLGLAGAAAYFLTRSGNKGTGSPEPDANVGSDEWVKVQNMLRMLGYSAAPTGVKDPATSAALIKFQVDNGLPVTGNYDSNTSAAAAKILLAMVQSWFPTPEELIAIKAQHGVITVTMIEDLRRQIEQQG